MTRRTFDLAPAVPRQRNRRYREQIEAATKEMALIAELEVKLRRAEQDLLAFQITLSSALHDLREERDARGVAEADVARARLRADRHAASLKKAVLFEQGYVRYQRALDKNSPSVKKERKSLERLQSSFRKVYERAMSSDG